MSHITRVGNLANVPKLKHGDNGPYLYARILVTDRIRRNGEWVNGPTIPYEVAVQGDYAVNLHRTAQLSGNVRVMFSGRTWADEYVPESGPARITHKVKADEIGISLQYAAVEVLATDAPPQPGAGAPAVQQDAPAMPDQSGAPAPGQGAQAGAAAYQELQQRVGQLVDQRYMVPPQATQVMQAGEAFINQPATAGASIRGAIAALQLPAAVTLFLLSIVDEFDGTGQLLSWNEAATRATPAQAAPAPGASAQGHWDMIAQARLDVGGGPSM